MGRTSLGTPGQLHFLSSSANGQRLDWISASHKCPKTTLSQHCLIPPTIQERPPPPAAAAATDKHGEKAPDNSPEQQSGEDTALQ